jgi:hypothetical protein
MSEHEQAEILARLRYLFGTSLTPTEALDLLIAQRDAAWYGRRDGQMVRFNGHTYYMPILHGTPIS